MKARAHPRQGERLAALYAYEILDTEREREFDEIVALTAAICEAPISVINLIDAERQWFKAEVGLGVRETPLETSLCSHAILEENFVEIRDTLTDPRMQDNPLVCTDPGLRFYAGALLTTESGLPIGTLCVLDHKPRELTPLQRDAIRVLALQVMTQLDLRRALATAETMRLEVDHRVKNSLQTVSAQTRLHARSLQSEEAKEALQHVIRRIDSVAALHELLYRTDAGNRIDGGRFLANVAGFVSRDWPREVTVDVDVQPFIVTSEQASSMGVILNEVASNAWKYAFAGRGRGRLDVAAAARPDGMAQLTVTDDGPGVTAAEASGSGLGLRIVEAAAAQLGGSLDMEGGAGGTRVTVTFPLQKAAAGSVA